MDFAILSNNENIMLHNMGLTSFPDLSKFNSIRLLYLSENSFTSLPTLPPNLTQLVCNNNQLTSLPTLPNTLRELYCSNNNLTSLPTLPDLTDLVCNNNQLTSLPTLPNNINQVICINNPIYSLPNFPEGKIYTYQETKSSKIVDPIKNKKNIRIINKFKHLYYSLKFKKHFIKLLKKSRERKTNKTNRIIIAILLIILVIVVIMLMMRNTKQYLSNKLPSSSTDTYEINISLMISILHVICSTFWKLYWR